MVRQPARDRRYILGGAWNEPNYQYRQSDARLPFDRSDNNGSAWSTLPDPAGVPAAAYGPGRPKRARLPPEKPVGDEVFAAFARRTRTTPVIRSQRRIVDEPSDLWRVERVSYTAAYGNERIVAYLFLPKHVAPPYQTVVYFPHSGGLILDSFQQAEMAYLGFLVKSGRALLFPMYKGTYERRLKAPRPVPTPCATS